MNYLEPSNATALVTRLQIFLGGFRRGRFCGRAEEDLNILSELAEF